MTFLEFSRVFLRKRRTMVLSRELAPSSLKADLIKMNFILERFGERGLGRIKSKDIDEYLDDLIISGKSPATRNRYRALLHTYFEYAVESGESKLNPVARIRELAERVKTRKIGYWRETGERDRYMASAFLFRRVFGVGSAILCLGGCRIAEALALTWQDVVWNGGFIRIRRIVERCSNTICERTKGQKAGGEYQMIMVPRLTRMLLDWKKESLYRGEDDLILTDTGRHFSYDQWRLMHQRVVKRAEVPMITLHDIRRTFATMAERAGFHKAEIGDLLGHETLQATEAYTMADLTHLIRKAEELKFGT